MDERFEKQLHFLIEVDQMKNVLRQTLLADGSRRENDAEHSWHFALTAMLLYEYAQDSRVDLSRVIKMALIHDLIEIYAGDTFAFDIQGNQDKEARERVAADRLFALLPPDQGQEIRSLWEEFDAMETPDSQYAAAIDRLQPFVNNSVTGGHTWKKNKITAAQVYQRMDMVRISAPRLWPFVEETIHREIEAGSILP
ncbi:HD domain-containing protein [Oscillospiraceae bacterium MB08-C2-2]|nr:HD domain-containing protein [Oscillospiraceae bacterium MB08-C2-2]